MMEHFDPRDAAAGLLVSGGFMILMAIVAAIL
jgi:hypothetical protein